jgi:hypothetical protein
MWPALIGDVAIGTFRFYEQAFQVAVNQVGTLEGLEHVGEGGSGVRALGDVDVAYEQNRDGIGMRRQCGKT